ncbi:MAG: ATP-binding protein [Gemmatimonadota bacterium]
MMLERVAASRVAPEPPSAAVPPPRAGARLPIRPGAAAAARRGWRPLTSARGRILGWSVLLLAAALAASAVVTHVLLIRQMDTRVRGELAHEAAEFRALAARRGAPAAGVPGSVVSLLRARTSQAVLENDVALIGLASGKVAAASANPAAAALRRDPALLARWSAVTRVTSGSAQLASGPVRYTAIPVRIAGDPARGVFAAVVFTGPDLATITRVSQLELEAGAVALLLGAGLAWLAAGRVLRPVRDTTELARRITETDLAGRIPARGRNEVSELAATFNQMLDRPAPAGLTELTVALAAKARGLDGRPWLLTRAADGVAVLDAQRITQAVMQLAANAVAHTPAGTVVELASAISGGSVEFTVTDHGPGVPAAERLRIFDRFARLDPRRTDGTGLGLSIVAAIAAAHGGRVSVTGRSGGGATFCLSVPYVRAAGRLTRETPT